MIAWLNLICLFVITALTAIFYIKSAGPAVLEQRIRLSAIIGAAIAGPSGYLLGRGMRDAGKEEYR